MCNGKFQEGEIRIGGPVYAQMLTLWASPGCHQAFLNAFSFGLRRKPGGAKRESILAKPGGGAGN